MSDLLRKLNKNICKLEENSSQSNSEIINLLNQLVELLSDSDLSLTPILYCDEDCNVTGAVATYIPDGETNPVQVFFDSTLTITNTPPTGQPCSVACVQEDVEFKYIEKEKCLPDGSKIVEVLCIPYLGLEQQTPSTFWVVNGVKTDTNPGAIDCVEECNPLIESFTGNNSTLDSFNSIEVFIPKCCNVTITTTAGTFTLPSQQSTWVYTKQFDCNVGSYNIESNCINEITTILTKTK